MKPAGGNTADNPLFLKTTKLQVSNMFSKTPSIPVAVLCVAMVTAPQTASAMDDDARKALIAAAAIAGVAAIAHHNKNHSDGKHNNNADYEAEFERGFRDGKYHADFNNYNDSEAYSDGYDSGRHDRNVQLAHNQRNYWEEDRHAGPEKPRKGCIREAADRWYVPRRDITPTSSRKAGDNRWEVIVSAGYHRATCVASKNGQVRSFEDQETNTHWGHNASHGRDSHPYSTNEYDATTEFRCSWGRPSHNKYCAAGISRGRGGIATINVRTPNGGERTLNFSGRNVQTPDGGQLTWGKHEGDWYIDIDDREYYVIPEAAIYGG